MPCACHAKSHLNRQRWSVHVTWPSEATNHWKNTVNHYFPTFSRTCIFFHLTFSPVWSSHFFSSALWLSASTFPSAYIVGSLTSKLPSLNGLSPCAHPTPVSTAGQRCAQQRGRGGPKGNQLLSSLDMERYNEDLWESFIGSSSTDFHSCPGMIHWP